MLNSILKIIPCLYDLVFIVPKSYLISFLLDYATSIKKPSRLGRLLKYIVSLALTNGSHLLVFVV